MRTESERRQLLEGISQNVNHKGGGGGEMKVKWKGERRKERMGCPKTSDHYDTPG